MLGVSSVPTPASSLPFRAALRDQYGWRSTHRIPPVTTADPSLSKSRDDASPISVSQTSSRIPSPSPTTEQRKTRSRSRASTLPPIVQAPSVSVVGPSAQAGNKRSRAVASSNAPRKRRRTNSTSTATSATSSTAVNTDPETAPVVPNRTLPPYIPIAADLARLYRRHPASSYVGGGKTPLSSSAARAEGAWNAPHSALDLYTPRFTKGVGRTKVGMCPICTEGIARGGEGRRLFLAMKQSAYNYHMMYYHGISPTTGLPFSPPVELRTVPHVPRSKIEKTELREGKCHRCARWVVLDTVKREHETKVKEQFWWKHAASCHGTSRLDDDNDAFVEDEIHAQILASMSVEDDVDQS